MNLSETNCRYSQKLFTMLEGNVAKAITVSLSNWVFLWLTIARDARFIEFINAIKHTHDMFDTTHFIWNSKIYEQLDGVAIKNF